MYTLKGLPLVTMLLVLELNSATLAFRQLMKLHGAQTTGISYCTITRINLALYGIIRIIFFGWITIYFLQHLMEIPPPLAVLFSLAIAYFWIWNTTNFLRLLKKDGLSCRLYIKGWKSLILHQDSKIYIYQL